MLYLPTGFHAKPIITYDGVLGPQLGIKKIVALILRRKRTFVNLGVVFENHNMNNTIPVERVLYF